MPIFLSRHELYRIIQRELPEDAYPDSGSPSAFFSTSDSDATAAVIRDYYCSQKLTYENYFAITATGAQGRLPDHEVTWFGHNLDQSQLSIAQRLQAVLTQIRYQPAPTLWNILTLALTFVPAGVRVGIIPYYSAQPFVYRVVIFQATISDAQVAALTTALLAAGPARCTFVIIQNASLAAYGYNWYVPNASQASLVQVAFVDPSSQITGYTGMTNVNSNESFFITDQQGNDLTDQDGNDLVTQGAQEQLTDQAGNVVITQGGDDIVTNQ